MFIIYHLYPYFKDSFSAILSISQYIQNFRPLCIKNPRPKSLERGFLADSFSLLFACKCLFYITVCCTPLLRCTAVEEVVCLAAFPPHSGSYLADYNTEDRRDHHGGTSIDRSIRRCKTGKSHWYKCGEKTSQHAGPSSRTVDSLPIQCNRIGGKECAGEDVYKRQV